MKKEQYAYIAGLIDGEGYIGLTRKDKHLWARIVIANCNLPLLEYAKSIVGGTINKSGKPRERWSQGYRLALPYVKEWLPKVIPHLFGKKKKAILLLEAIKINNIRKKMTNQAGDYGKKRLEEINILLRKKEWLL